MRIAINQPYFIPYAGYFRLFSEADIFVIYDDVQYSYPGFIHRNRLTKHNGDLDWLTLPLMRKPLATKIKDIEFADNAADKWGKSYKKFKLFSKKPLTHLAQTVALAAGFVNPMRVIMTTLDMTRLALGIFTPVVFSSELNIAPELKGQDRVLAICDYFKATEYINAAGGAGLYDPYAFKFRAVKLKILKPYEGNKASILERLSYEKPADVRKEIEANAQFIS